MRTKIIFDAIKNSFKKLDIKSQKNNFVMFLVYICAIFTSIYAIIQKLLINEQSEGDFSLLISIFLWITVIFANFAQSMAEGKGKAGADYLRKTKTSSKARILEKANINSNFKEIDSAFLKKGDIVLVKAKEQIPLDGEVIEGAASVDESAITGESAPVIREAGGDRNSVTGGTTVLSDYLIIKITVSQGESFLDKMIEMIEGTSRKKTPNEIALEILLITLSIIFIFVTISFYLFSHFSGKINFIPINISIVFLISFFVCLIPTTIGGLLSSIGIAGMTRLNEKNVLAMSGRAIEAAGDIDILLLDKTGTITLGNREAYEFLPLNKDGKKELAYYASLCSVTDETPEGRSIVVLAKNEFNIRHNNLGNQNIEWIPFSANTKISGVNINEMKIRKGSARAIEQFIEQYGMKMSNECMEIVNQIAQKGGTPLVVTSDKTIYGVVYLKDIIKGGIKEKFNDLRKMGIKTIMITGDNEITAHAIAREAGVDDFLAEATPETKLKLIRKFQEEGHLVAMTGDGTNDAPALAAADVAVAMNSGTTAAKEAGNMIDLDSNPTKLIEIIQVGKQLLMTRGALTTFSIANDIAKYFAIIPMLLIQIYPKLEVFNIMRLTNTKSAILSAIIFNTFIILALIPIALKGVKYKEIPSNQLLKRNLLLYGLGGVITPFIGIKLIDMFITNFIK